MVRAADHAVNARGLPGRFAATARPGGLPEVVKRLLGATCPRRAARGHSAAFRIWSYCWQVNWTRLRLGLSLVTTGHPTPAEPRRVRPAPHRSGV